MTAAPFVAIPRSPCAKPTATRVVLPLMNET